MNTTTSNTLFSQNIHKPCVAIQNGAKVGRQRKKDLKWGHIW